MTQLDFEKLDGLVPVIVQNYQTKKVLMLGFMNDEAYKKTLQTNLVTFYSRTKKRLWQKGEESGNTLEVIKIEKDCDDDTLLIQVKPNGPTCHTEKESCFDTSEPITDFSPSKKNQKLTALPRLLGEGRGEVFASQKPTLQFLSQLYTTIAQRKKDLPENSYTTSLFKKGLNKITQKVGEEANEVVIAALGETDERLIDEISDLIYHLFVLLVEKEISLEDIAKNLQSRSNQACHSREDGDPKKKEIPPLRSE